MKRGRPRKRRVAGLSFPDDGDVAVVDVGEDGVTGGDSVCGFCGEPKEAHLEGRGACSMNDCKRFREL